MAAAAILGAFMLSPCAAAAAIAPAADVPQIQFRDLGVAPPRMPVAIAVTLRYRNADQLEQLIESQSDPASPLYRRWLTSAEFAQAFAPTEAQYEQVASSLRRAGLLVTQTYSNRTVIDAIGGAASIERYFNTRIDRVAQPGYGMRYANVMSASAPSDLGELVLSVSGLNDLAIVKSAHIRAVRPLRSRAVLEPEQTAQLYGPAGAGGGRGYAPLVFQRSYDLPVLHARKNGFYDGTGVTSAVLIDADFLDSDLAQFLTYFHINRSARTVRVYVDHPTRGLSKDSVEATLDVETIAANAPGATLYVYEVPTFSSANAPITDAYNAVVSQNKVDAVNSSFGLCEFADRALSTAWNHIAMQAAALGITFHASTGDVGSNCSSGGWGVQAPASSPYVVAVGGTSLSITKDGAYKHETGWANEYGASGGGFSLLFKLPSWQRGVANVEQVGRNLPDVSFDGDPLLGTAFYLGGTWNNDWNPIGGTSLSSPIFGAAIAEIDEMLGGRSGLAARTLFELWGKDGYVDAGTTYFHDSTVGNNGSYRCLKGYDMVTGIGSLDVWNVGLALQKKKS